MIDIRKLPNLDIEQQKFTADFYRLFGHRITNVEPVLYQGVYVGSEFSVYAGTKLYLCFDLIVSYDNVATNVRGTIYFHNELNVIFIYTRNLNLAWDSVGVQVFHQINDFNIKNIWFSRFTTVRYNYLKFIGYRITYV